MKCALKPNVSPSATTKRYVPRLFLLRPGLLAILALDFVLFCKPGAAQQDNKTVFFLHSEAAEAPVFVAEEQRIRSVLKSSLNNRVQFFVEYMDHSRVEHPGYLDSLATYLQEKYTSKRIDLEVTIGPEALPFVVQRRTKLFPRTPVVFSYPDVGFLKHTSLPANITGLIPRLEIKPTLDLILMVQPETRHVAVVLGPSSTRPNLANDLESVKTQAEPFRDRLAFTFIDERRIADVASQVAALPPGTPTLYLFFVGSEGKDFISAVNAADVVANVAKGPIYDVSDAHMGHGIVGGWLSSDADYQTDVAQLALQVLQGTKPPPAIHDAGGKYIFDERQLKRWKIDPDKLPPGSEIRFHQSTPWEQYKWWILGGVGVIVFQTLLIAGLLVQRKRRKGAEERLSRRGAELSEAQRLAGVGSWQWDARTDTVIWSEGLYRIVGLDPKLPAPSYKDQPSLYSAESWQRLQRAVEEALQTGTSYELDMEIVHSGVTSKWAVARGEPLRDAGGQIIGLRGTLQDITERKLSEEALRKSEERERAKAKELEAVLDTAPVAIYIATDANCAQITANRYGYELLNLEIGSNASTSAPADERPKFRIMRDGIEIPPSELPIQRAVATGTPTPATNLSVIFADGTERHILANASPLFGPDGKLRGAVGTSLDVTDRKVAEEALSRVSRSLIKAQEQERTRIAQELHDDIGQRLALLANLLERLQEEHLDLPAETWNSIGELRKQTCGIATDIQSLSHELHSAKLEYLGLAAAMRSFCREFGEQQKVTINFSTRDLPSPLPSEISLCLFRILQEALHNSVKHSGVQHCEVRLWGAVDGIHLTVEDSDAGFDSEAAKESRGLGLISMQERLKLLKGTFSIESQPKRGTTIHARAPLTSGSDSLRATG